MNIDHQYTGIILTVGNSMMGDDGAGPLLAEKLQQQPIEQWFVIDGGSTPENVVHNIRQLKPKQLLIVDATEMGLAPGEVRFVDVDLIAEMFLMNTHNMPLTFLVEQLKEDIPIIDFLGIQPDIVGFYYPMTEKVKQGIDKIYDALKSDRLKTEFIELNKESNYESIYQC